MASQKHSLRPGVRFAGLLSSQRGSISVLTALTMVPFFVAAGMAVDMGKINRTLAHMQKAVDSAALAAAATRLPVTTVDGALAGDEARIEVALRMVAANLADDVKTGAEDPVVTIDGEVVEVDLEAVMPTSFMYFVGFETVNLSVTAAADFSVTGHSCILALGAGGNGIEVGGTVDLEAEDCWIHSNKVGEKSIDIIGTARVDVAGTRSVGTTSVTNQAEVPPPQNRHTQSYRIDDPKAEWEHPFVPGTCDYNRFKQNAGAANSSVTLSPGRYCGGLQLSGYSQVHFSPGIYHISDGPLTINSKADVTGEGIGFYLTDDVTSVTINGASTVSLSAYGDGVSPMDGMLFAMEGVDPDVNDPIAVKINGGAGLDLTGTIYLPTGELEIAGNSATESTATQIIAHSVKLTSTLKFKHELDAFGNPIGAEFVTVVKLVK